MNSTETTGVLLDLALSSNGDIYKTIVQYHSQETGCRQGSRQVGRPIIAVASDAFLFYVVWGQMVKLWCVTFAVLCKTLCISRTT